MELYFKILEKNKINELDELLENAYEKYENIIFVFDLREYKNKINLKLLLKLRPVIEKHQKEEKKIKKIYLVIPKNGPVKIIKFFLKIVKNDVPIEIVESWPTTQCS